MQSFLYQNKEDFFCESSFHALRAPNQWFYPSELLYFLLMAILLDIVVSYAFDKCGALHSKDAHPANCYTMYSKGKIIYCMFL